MSLLYCPLYQQAVQCSSLPAPLTDCNVLLPFLIRLCPTRKIATYTHTASPPFLDTGDVLLTYYITMSLIFLDISTSYSCECYLHEDHTPLLPGSRGMYRRRCNSMTTLTHLLLRHVGLTTHTCHTSIVLYISRLSNVLPYPHLNRLQGLVAILDTPISYPYNCYLHTYHIPPLLGHCTI